MKKKAHATLKQLEHIVRQAGFAIRYEKGHFQSGWCRVKDRNIILINRFYPPEVRLHILLNIIDTLDLASQITDPQDLDFIQSLRRHQKSSST